MLQRKTRLTKWAVSPVPIPFTLTFSKIPPKSERKIPRGPQTSAQSYTTSGFRLVINEIQLLHYQRTFLTLMVDFFRNLQLRVI